MGPMFRFLLGGRPHKTLFQWCDCQGAGWGEAILMAEIVAGRYFCDEGAARSLRLEAQGQIQRDAGAGRAAPYDRGVRQMQRCLWCLEAVVASGGEAALNFARPLVQEDEDFTSLVEEDRDDGVVASADAKLQEFQGVPIERRRDGPSVGIIQPVVYGHR